MKNWELISALSKMPAGADVKLLVGVADDDMEDNTIACELADDDRINIVSEGNWVRESVPTSLSEQGGKE